MAGYAKVSVNTVDLTTVESTNDNKHYLVDKRLVDFLLDRVTKGSLEDLKANINGIVVLAETKEDLFKKLDDFIYLDKIVQLVDPVVKDDLTIGEAIDAVGNGKTAAQYREDQPITNWDKPLRTKY